VDEPDHRESHGCGAGNTDWKTVLIHDRDPLFTAEFLDMIAHWSGVREVTPAFSKPERLRGEICAQHQGVLPGSHDLLRGGVVAGRHAELSSHTITVSVITKVWRTNSSNPKPGHLGTAGEVQRRQRMGDMLNYYYRAA
jgi:hypothetical protein